jgi:hypothetical protein
MATSARRSGGAGEPPGIKQQRLHATGKFECFLQRLRPGHVNHLHDPNPFQFPMEFLIASAAIRSQS